MYAYAASHSAFFFAYLFCIAVQTTESLFTHGDITLPTELALELVDLFFIHINSVFPIIYRPSLRHEISNGTASKPLLWAIMAISAR